MVASMGLMAGMILVISMLSLGIAMVTGVLVHATVVHHVFHAGLPRFHAAVENGLVESRIHLAVITHRVIDTRLFQLQVLITAQVSVTGLHLGDPGGEVLFAQPVEIKLHLRVTGATVVGRKALVDARLVDHPMQLGFHARHGIDLSGHGRNEEGIHHDSPGPPVH